MLWVNIIILNFYIVFFFYGYGDIFNILGKLYMIKWNFCFVFVVGVIFVVLVVCSLIDIDMVLIMKNEFNGFKNIIMVVVDGMGLVYIMVYWNYVDDSKIVIVEMVVFDDLLVGNVFIYFV